MSVQLPSAVTSPVEKTIYLSGRYISASQKPHVEADIASARKVLERLMVSYSGDEVSSIKEIVREIACE